MAQRSDEFSMVISFGFVRLLRLSDHIDCLTYLDLSDGNWGFLNEGLGLLRFDPCSWLR